MSSLKIYFSSLADLFCHSSGQDLLSTIQPAFLNSFLHSRTLLFAATDTSSSAILRTLLVLAEHPEFQTRVREEILAAKAQSDGELSYDKLLALPLLDAVYRETLRLSVSSRL